MKRYPVQALADMLDVEVGALTRILNVSGSTWKQYRDEGVSERVADRLATKVGLVTYRVWPEMVDDIIADESVECAEPTCDDTFIPRWSRHAYCSPTCRRRAAKRRERQSADGAMKNRERRRRHYQENGEYERARQRAYERQLRASKAA